MIPVLYLSYDGLTDPLGQSQVLPYLEALSKHGYRFTIISFEKSLCLEKEGEVIRSICSRSSIEWIPLSFTSRPPVLSKIYDRYRMWKTALQQYRSKKFHLIHCRSYVAAEVGLKLKKKYGVRFLFDMRGFWADEKVDNGQWDLNRSFYKKIYRHYKQKEKEFLHHADGIISLTEAGKNFLQSQEGGEHLPVTVIPCCADLEHFNYQKQDPGEVQALRRSLQIPDEAKVITYLGSVGGWYMTKEMFSFFRRLVEKDPQFHMLLLTKDDAAVVKKEAESFGIPLSKVTVTYSDRKRLPLYLSLSTFSIFFIRNTFSKMASSPTKHAELMGMGIPVICNEIGDTGIIIRETKTGMLVNTFDETSMNTAIGQLDQLSVISKEKIRDCAFQYFDLKEGAEKYHQVYRQILQPKRQDSVSLHV